MTNILCFTLILLSTNVHAWSIKRLKGDANISRAGELIPAQEGFSLVGSDVIQTSAKTRMLIEDGSSRIWLGSKTKFKVGELGSRRGGKKGIQILNLLHGKIRSLVRKKSDGRRQLKFKTPTAVAGVRGTEFFIESTGAGEFFCTLDGSIEVQTNKGEAFVVDQGKGLRLALGKTPNLAGTSSLLVDRWVSETSFEKQDFIPSSNYGNDKDLKHKLADSDIYYGGFGSAYLCHANGLSYPGANYADGDCSRFYLSPFVQWGSGRRAFLRAAVLGTYTEESRFIDDVPLETGRDATAVTVAEAFLEDSYWGWNFRLGLQDVDWADGVLLSSKAASIEPISHLALRAVGSVGSWELEFLGGPGLEDKNELLGHTHIKTLGLKGKLPEDRGELYLLHANFGELGGKSPNYHGHELINAGYYLNKKRGDWDYRVSYLHQEHTVHTDQAGNSGVAAGNLGDLSVGRQLNLARPARASVRWMKASKDFIPVLQDYYMNGASQLFGLSANLEQWRAKLELQVTAKQMVSLEYLRSFQVSGSGFVSLVNNNESDIELADEIDFSHSVVFFDRLKWVNTIWSVEPKFYQLGTDSALGINSRLSFSY